MEGQRQRRDGCERDRPTAANCDSATGFYAIVGVSCCRALRDSPTVVNLKVSTTGEVTKNQGNAYIEHIADLNRICSRRRARINDRNYELDRRTRYRQTTAEIAGKYGIGLCHCELG